MLGCQLHTDTGLDSIRSIRRVARCLAETWGAPQQVAEDIELAVGEALANAHLHAYPVAIGPVEVWIDVADGVFICTIRDHGCGIMPHVLRARQGSPEARWHGSTATTEVPGASRPARKTGWGFYLMEQLMDGVVLSPPDGRERGTVVRMSKALR